MKEDVYNNLTSYLLENPWLNRFIELEIPRKQQIFYAGGRASLQMDWLEAKISYSYYKRFLCFQ
jgi:hypothetical protein